jgi:hypothetical protein
MRPATSATPSMDAEHNIRLTRAAVTSFGGATHQGVQRLSIPILPGRAVPTHSSPYEPEGGASKTVPEQSGEAVSSPSVPRVFVEKINETVADSL